MSFGFDTSNQQSQQSSSGSNASLGESFGSSFTEGTTGSQSTSSSFTDPDSVWGPQAGGLQNLYGAAGDIFGQAGNQAGNQVFGQAMGAFNNLTNPGMNPAMQAYGNQIGQTLTRDWLPQIQGGAIQAGQLGGGRQGIAEGLALSDATQQFTDAGRMLYNQDQDRRLGAVGQAGQLANLGMGIPWYNAQQYGGLLGRPTVLGGASGSQQQQTSFGQNTGGSSDYGYNVGYGQNQSQGTGSGSSLGLNVPLFF